MKQTRYNPMNGQVKLLSKIRASRTNKAKRECLEVGCHKLLFSKRNMQSGFCAKCRKRRKIK